MPRLLGIFGEGMMRGRDTDFVDNLNKATERPWARTQVYAVSRGIAPRQIARSDTKLYGQTPHKALWSDSTPRLVAYPGSVMS